MHDATPAQVALAWLIAKPNVVAIPGASSVEQLRHNVAAADLELDDKEVEELTAESDEFEPLGVPQTAVSFAAQPPPLTSVPIVEFQSFRAGAREWLGDNRHHAPATTARSSRRTSSTRARPGNGGSTKPA